MEETSKKRPRGILIITIITGLSGILLLIMSAYTFSLFIPLGGGVLLMGPSFLLILGGTSLLSAYGLYMIKKWAWPLTLIISGFGAAGYLLNVVNGQFISIVGVIYNAAIIYYLYRPHIRKYYGRPHMKKYRGRR